jgi:hypothetical protein
MWNYVENSMPNITLAIDETLLKQVRSYAKRNGITVNGLVRKNMTDLVQGERSQKKARLGLKKLMAEEAERTSAIHVPDELLNEIRKVAAARKTTVSAVVFEQLEQITDKKRRAREAMAELKAMSLKTKSDLGPDYKFDRASLYER